MEYNSSDKLAIALACLAGVMAIVLFLVEKTPVTVVSLLLLMLALSVYPILHFAKRIAWRAAALVGFGLGTVLLGWYAWPHRHLMSTSSHPQEMPQQVPPQTTKGEPEKKKKTQEKARPKTRVEQRSQGDNSPNVGSISQGPCSNLQVGGSGNQATTNCGPRLRFPEQQIDALAQLLAVQHGTVGFVVENSDSTILQDANNLLRAFAKAKWTTEGIATIIHGTDIGPNGLPIIRVGIHIYGRPESTMPDFIKGAIKQVTGIEAHKDADENRSSNSEIEIFIGAWE